MTEDPKPAPWTVTGSSYAYRDRFLAHRLDTCVTERGAVLDPYHVIELKDWAHVVALTPDGRIVLVEEYRHAGGAVERGLPAGTVEPGEDVKTAMRRELMEETGYSAATWIDLGAMWTNPALNTNRATTFLALDAMPGGDRNLDPGETIAVLTQPAGLVFDEAMTGTGIRHAIQLAGLFLAREYARRHAADDARLQPLAG